MTRAVSPKLGAYAALAAAGLFAGLALQQVELIALGAPFLVLVGLALVLGEQPRLSVEAELSEERRLEGQSVELVVRVAAERAVPHLELGIALPEGITCAGGDDLTLISLRSGEQRELRLELDCERWGAYRLGTVWARAQDRFGLFRFDARFESGLALKVYPRPEVARALVHPRETQVFVGNQVARLRGEGIEFADLRPFLPGDRVRRINWRASARRGELWINEHHPERNADVVLLIDSFVDIRGEGGGTLDRAVHATAALADRYLRHKDRVGLLTLGGALRWLVPGSGLTQLYRLIDTVLETEVIPTWAWSGITFVPRRTLPPRALVLALTPLVDDRATGALLDLRGRGFDVAAIEISPLPYLAPPRKDTERVARRLWALERELRRARLLESGVPVAAWDEQTPIDIALEEVKSYRRYRTSARV